MSELIYTGQEWTTDKLYRVYDECEIIGAEELKLSWYSNQFEIVNYDEMLNVYTSIGMPMMYNHWSFGKSFSRNYEMYKQGRMGLALEMVINSNPCINYLMDENTMTGQALVIAHAAIGHNSFFKNNYLYKEWTDASAIIDYLSFAKNYIAKCEEKYGYEEVELILDAAHALMNYGVDRYRKPKTLSSKEEEKRSRGRVEAEEKNYDAVWDLVPSKAKKKTTNPKYPNNFLPNGPEENLLYFLEKKSPVLRNWQREIVRIVRKVSQYFSPQGQTKVINEGWASTVHYYIINRLYEKKLIDDGSMLEFLALHTAVVRQEEYDSKYFNGFNPYHLGYTIFKDMKRVCQSPTAEDKIWFPDVAGSDWVETWNYMYQNFRDDSFIQQFMSPKVIRDLRLFSYLDEEGEKEYTITDIHNERGYREIRNVMAEQNAFSRRQPDIQITSVDYESRTCFLSHYTDDEVLLDSQEAEKTLNYFQALWGFNVLLCTYSRRSNELLFTYPIPFVGV